MTIEGSKRQLGIGGVTGSRRELRVRLTVVGFVIVARVA